VFAEELYQSAFSNGRHADLQSWDKFRRCILEPGGSKDELQMLRDFCGNDPSPDALLRSLGLKAD
jgi:Zn-dependent oligopeptidase